MNIGVIFSILAATACLPASAFDCEVQSIAPNCASSCRGSGRYGIGEYRDGKSVVWWPGPRMARFVATYDPASNQWSPRVRVAAPSDSPDRHDSPARFIDTKGYVLVFLSMHNGFFFHAKSSAPLSVEGDGEVMRATGSATYPNPVRASNGDRYCFYRKGWATDRYLACIKSTDDCGMRALSAGLCIARASVGPYAATRELERLR
jgi:hypothetical protein